MKRFRIALPALVALAQVGCWTSAETGQQLLRRVSRLEAETSEARAELANEVSRAQTKLRELEQVLEQATAVVRRASADTGAQVEQLEERLNALTGRLEELRNEVQRQLREGAESREATERRLRQLGERVGMDVTLDPSDIPEEADAHWNSARQAFDGGRMSRARALFRAFLTSHADDPRAPEAQYRVGLTYLRDRRPATALGELRRVLSDHRGSDAVDDALLAMSEAFWQLHACSDARSTLEALIRSHRRSPLLARARQKLRRIRNAPRGYCRS